MSETQNPNPTHLTYEPYPDELGGGYTATCQECGAHQTVRDRGNTGIQHEATCSHSNPAVDPYPETEEVDETPL